MNVLLAFLGRLMIALLFLVSGVNKLLDLTATNTMIESVGLPGGLAVLVGLFEVAAGIALVFGIATRLVAIALAVFCLVTAFFFHNNFLDPTQSAMLLKNVAIAGGLLGITALDSVRWSYDAYRLRRRAEIAELRATNREHDAEVRAARAEGAAAATRSTFGGPVAATSAGAAIAPDGTVVPKRRWFF